MKKKIYEASELPENEKVYLKKDWTGWRVIEPFEDPTTGKKNWFSGTKKTIIPFLFVLLIMILFLVGFNESTESMRSALNQIFSNPAKFCEEIQTKGICTPEWRQFGLCQEAPLINVSFMEGSPN